MIKLIIFLLLGYFLMFFIACVDKPKKNDSLKIEWKGMLVCINPHNDQENDGMAKFTEIMYVSFLNSSNSAKVIDLGESRMYSNIKLFIKDDTLSFTNINMYIQPLQGLKDRYLKLNANDSIIKMFFGKKEHFGVEKVFIKESKNRMKNAKMVFYNGVDSIFIIPKSTKFVLDTFSLNEYGIFEKVEKKYFK